MKIACLAFVTAIALINVIAALRQAWQLFQKKIYQCPGRIVASRIGSAEEWQGGNNKLMMYWPEVEFEYDAGGGTLIGNRISTTFLKTSKRREIDRIVAVYPIGKEVKVFYNPDDVTDAYLKDPRKHIPTFLFIALGMALFGGLMDWMIWVVVP